MRVVQGRPISPGYAKGRAFILRRALGSGPPRYGIEPQAVGREHRRLANALQRSIEEVRQLRDRVAFDLGEAESEIFEAHLALLADAQLIDRIREHIATDLVNAEQAVVQEVDIFGRLLARAQTRYLRERKDDVYDVGRRVLRHLGHGRAEVLHSLPPESILVAAELLPSDTIAINRSGVTGVILERGGATSHAAILARSIGIPTISGIEDACSWVPQGTELLVDGERGEVTISPSSQATRRFMARRLRYNDEAQHALAHADEPCVTLDGERVMLLANIGTPAEAERARENSMDGIGLFRTEAFFLDRDTAPTLDLQRSAYNRVLRLNAGQPVAIRTLDLGGDKRPRFLVVHFEANPSLGLRGLRFSLTERRLFETQLTALLDVGRDHSELSVVLPMVLGGSDLGLALELIDEIAADLGRPRPHVSAMVETPSAIFELDEILELADSLSLGTNDLIQFMLAADRNAVDLLRDDAVLQPAVLRAISEVVRRAREAGKPLTMCGEAAGNPVLACVLAGLGLERLSISPVRAPRVRTMLRSQRMSDLRRLAASCVDCHSREEVVGLVTEALGPPVP